MDDSDKLKMVADFMLAEFNTLIERARDFDQINASRINFYLIIVAAVGAGLGAATDLQPVQSNYLWIVLAALSGLLLLGLVTLYYTVNSTISSIKLYRYAGRVRCWFAEQAPQVVPFFPFSPTDARPRFATRFWTFRGEEAIVAAVNAILLSGIIVIVLYQSQVISRPGPAIILALATCIVAWILQRWCFRMRMDRAEDTYGADDIHFDEEQYRAHYRARKDAQSTD
jgi:hypothetical protein